MQPNNVNQLRWKGGVQTKNLFIIIKNDPAYQF